jgi:hypothetical protein
MIESSAGAVAKFFVYGASQFIGFQVVQTIKQMNTVNVNHFIRHDKEGED